MNCLKVMDLTYEYSGNELGCEGSMPLLTQIQIWLHSFICHDCDQQIRRFEETRTIMTEDFFQQVPSFEDSIMAKIGMEIEDEQAHAPYTTQSGISTRGWIIAGFIVMVSLITTFFGLDFQNLASESGTSYILPIGITIGIVLTIYGALFIGSNLKELSERFGL